jgi:hypothetical protein
MGRVGRRLNSKRNIGRSFSVVNLCYDHIGNVCAVVRDEGTGNYSILLARWITSPLAPSLSQMETTTGNPSSARKDYESSLGDFGVRKYIAP